MKYVYIYCAEFQLDGGMDFQMGKFESSIGMSNHDDENEEDEVREFKKKITRQKLPDIGTSALSQDEFLDLPVDSQFAYVYPTIHRIVTGQYPPAKYRHDLFMRGGRFRSSLSQSAGGHGFLPKKVAAELLACIERWLIPGKLINLRIWPVVLFFPQTKTM